MTTVAVAIGTPLGILAGTYMAEYGRYDKLDHGGALHQRHPVERAVDRRSACSSTRSWSPRMGHFSGWAGAVALAVIVVPVVVRTTEDMLTLVPDTLREAAASIGLPRSLMIQKIAYRAARAGMITGVLLAVARISGETAPLLFTALNNQFWSLDMNAPVASLPVIIFQFALSPYHDWQQLAWTGALIITMAVLTLSISPASSRHREKHHERSKFHHADGQPRAGQQPRGSKRRSRCATSISSTAINRALKSINVSLYQSKVTAFIGPSGCGKSTLLRVLNRMYDLYPNQRASGHVRLDDEDILSPGQDLNLLRAKVGMVFQKPTPFPMTIYENIAFGIRLYERLPKSELDDRVKHCLQRAALWDEVKDKMNANGLSLSGGQQQRLCIARTVAVRPEVILFDEPCSALDPISTAKIEELIDELKEDYTIAIVTHNMQQAARVSDFTAFMYLGELVEFGETTTIFTSPSDRRTQDYITGRFGYKDNDNDRPHDQGIRQRPAGSLAHGR